MSLKRGWLLWAAAGAVAIGLLLGGPAGAAAEDDEGGMPGEAREARAGMGGLSSVDRTSGLDLMQMVRAMHPGWNLGNSLDATGSETSWGNPRTTREMIEQIAAAGFRSIRIPVTWGHRMGGPPEYRIDPAFMARVQEIVDWALEAGLFVIINMHHDTSQWIIKMPQDREGVLARFEAAWRQIAAHFRDYPRALLFEGVNEPRFSDDWGADSPLYFELVDELQKTFHRVVRSSGGANATRPLLLTTLTGSTSAARMAALARTIEELKDERLIATVHYYGYYPFSVNVAGATRFDERVAADVREALDRAHAMFVERGVPVIVGEFGLLGFDRSIDTIQRGERLKFFEYLTYYAKEKGITLMLWDNGQHFDRRRGVFRDPALYETIMASLDGRASQAETDQLFFKRHEPLRDARLGLRLNGNELVEAAAGERALTAGVDYEVEPGGVLVLKKEFLERILTDELGPNAVVRLRFSHGPEWPVELIVYDTPELDESRGTTSSFVIPARFHGDRLATMEAVYRDGRNAGPAEWTPFKEFGLAFWPEYAQGRIRLTREFLESLRDGEVVLRFHFWSGEVVPYVLEKSGASVTGRPGR